MFGNAKKSYCSVHPYVPRQLRVLSASVNFMFSSPTTNYLKIPILRPPNSRHVSQSSQREFPLSRRGRDLLPQCQQRSPSASSLWSFAHQSNKQQLKRVHSDIKHHTMFPPQKNQMQKNLLFWA